jgi:hypothetical protein
MQRVESMAAQLVDLHREHIFALARQLCARDTLDSRAVTDIFSGAIEADEFSAGLDARRACRSGT